MELVTDIFEVFTKVGEWITTQISALQPMFYGENGLTFMGLLAVVGLGMSVIFLLIGVIQRFLHFRG